MNDTEPGAADAEHVAADVLDVLRCTLDRPSLTYAEAPTRLGGGFWADIFAVRFSDAPPELQGDLVLRVMPDDLFGRRETVVQREVAAQGFPAPIVRLAGDGAGGLGRPYLVMERSAGVPLMSGISAGRAVASLPRLMRQLPRLLARTALELHLIDPDPIADALRAEVPDAAVNTTDMLDRLTSSARDLGARNLMAATTWLASRQPTPERASVCHGDLHPFNLLVDHDGRVTLVDWTASMIAEPAFDVAFTGLLLRSAPVNVPPFARPVIRRAAGRLADRVDRTYRDLAAPHGIRVDAPRLAWYTALHRTRILLEVARWDADGELDRHRGHPFLGMRDAFTTRLAATIER